MRLKKNIGQLYSLCKIAISLYDEFVKEIITTLEPRQIHHLMALHNSVIFDSKDRKVQRIIKGVGLGAYRELKSEGLQEAADDTIFEARREKLATGGAIYKG